MYYIMRMLHNDENVVSRCVLHVYYAYVAILWKYREQMCTIFMRILTILGKYHE